jgi:cell wall assembly regulator SMI1
MANLEDLDVPSLIDRITSCILSSDPEDDSDERRTIDTFNPGATDEQLTALENTLGFPLPSELRSFLKVHDGQRYDRRLIEFPAAPWTRFLPCAEIASCHRSMEPLITMTAEEFGIDPWDDVPVGYQVPANHLLGHPEAVLLGRNDRWVPFAISNGSIPTYFVIDCDPPADVPVGRVLAFGGEGAPLSIFAPSLKALLVDVLSVLHKRYGTESEEEEEDEDQEEEVGDDGNDSHLSVHAIQTTATGRHVRQLFNDGPRIWHQYMWE